MSKSFSASVARCGHCFLVVFLGVAFSQVTTPDTEAGDCGIEFDMPLIVAGECQDTPTGARRVKLELRLSSLVHGDARSRADQWIIRCKPRSAMKVTDYEPRTELHSGIEGPIKVTRTKEDTDSLGTAADVSYSNLAGGHAGTDDQHKRTDSQQFNRIAPLHAVVAAGTIDRGQGVFFKLRETPTSVLEGEKQFRLTFEVPTGWRGVLLDVFVDAQRDKMTFSGQSESETILAKHFVVAVYCQGDDRSQALAQQLAQQERTLRELAARSNAKPAPWATLPWKQTLESLTPWNESHDLSNNSASWLERFLAGSADPLVDKTICKLQMPDRVAVLNYARTRNAFLKLSRETDPTEDTQSLVSTNSGT